MTERSEVRTRITIDNAGKAQTDIAGVEKHLKDMAQAGKVSASALERMQAAFSPLRRNLEMINQIKGVFSAATGAAGSFVDIVRNLAGRTPDTTRALSDLDRATNSLVDQFARGLNEGNRFSNILDEITSSIHDQEGVAKSAGSAISRYLQLWLEYGPSIYRIIGNINELINGPALGTHIPTDATEFGENPDTSVSDAIKAARERERELREAQNRNLPKGGGGSSNRTPDMVFQSTDEMIDQLAGTAGAFNDILTQIGQTQESSYNDSMGRARSAQEEYNAYLNEAKNAQIYLAEKQRDIETTANDERLAHIREVAEFEEALNERRRQQVENVINQTEGYGGALNTVMGSIADVFGQASSEFREGSKEAERYKKIQGGILAGISFVNAAIEIAKAVGSGAEMNFVSMAAHIASSIAYIAAGGLALRNLGGSAQAPAGATFTPAQAKEPKTSDSAGKGATTINNFMWAQDQGRMGVEFQRAEWRAKQSGLDPALTGQGGYY
jgi:hypothetical protein